MNHLIYEPEYRGEVAGYYRVFAYVQPDRKLVVVWQQKTGAGGWKSIDDFVCEDFEHFILVWQDRWE